MKNLHFIGFLLLGLAFLLYYMLPQFSVVKLFEPINLMGILAGIGIGLIIGGIVGYVSKGTALKEEEKRREIKQLRKENEDLEKQAAELAKQQSTTYTTTETQNPPNY
jgi:cell division protein FtsB